MPVYEKIEFDKYKTLRQIRSRMPSLPIDERVKGFAEVDSGFNEELALREAMRCFLCNSKICTGCKQCAQICPNNSIEVTTRANNDFSREVVRFTIKHDTCIYCGLCVEVCPSQALTMKSGQRESVLRKQDLVFNYVKTIEIEEPPLQSEPQLDSSTEESEEF